MSIPIRYTKQEFPSFPILDIEIANVVARMFIPQKGKIDTGAYITVIPPYLIKLLNLKKASSTEGKGVDSPYQERDTYYVHIKINSTIFEYVEVADFGERDNVLIGRNILNLWRMNLDGQSHTGEFTPWSLDTINAT